LAERYRVLVVDPLGHGLSDKPHEWQAFSKPDIAADAIAVMDAAGVDVAALWGYSRGGGLAYAAAIGFPRRVTTLVIGGTIIGPKVPTPATTEAPPETQALLRGDWEPFFANVYPCPDWERDLHRERSDPAATGAILEGSRRSNYRTDLNLISVSTLLYVADDDVADPEAANALGCDATALKIEAKILEGHNHDTAFEDSYSLVPLVISHLDAVSKPSGS
jgi:pimeloyl-ACP methyl ester carboxylesterase